MEALLDTLTEVVERARGAIGSDLAGGGIRAASDDELLAALRLAADGHRLLEAVLIEATGEVQRRSTSVEKDARLTTRLGCHNVNELVQRATRLAGSTVGKIERGTKAIAERESLLGEAMPALLPAMRDALLEGYVGVDGLVAVAGSLMGVSRDTSVDAILVADAALAAEARGEGADGAVPLSADLLRLQSQLWATVLDQDGAEPREQAAIRKRGISLGTSHEGLRSVRGFLLEEIAAQLELICDATTSPRVSATGGVTFRPDAERSDGEEGLPKDSRSSAQRMHDAFATAVTVAAASEQLPTLGGAAPTLLVSVRQEDLAAGTGWAHIGTNGEPVSLHAAQHAGCVGVTQRVLMADNGHILRLGTEERVFNRHQRRAIALRDGGCVIPGCGVKAAWSEIHHVTEYANDGPTHTDNGVLLCWYHHRFLPQSGWKIRMNCGVPEVLAPPWLDPDRRWRSATTSATRLRANITPLVQY